MPRSSKFRDQDSLGERELPRQRWKEQPPGTNSDLEKIRKKKNTSKDPAAFELEGQQKSEINSGHADSFVEVISSKLPVVELKTSPRGQAASGRAKSDASFNRVLSDKKRSLQKGSSKSCANLDVRLGSRLGSVGSRISSQSASSFSLPKADMNGTIKHRNHLLDTRDGEWGGGGAIDRFQQNRNSVAKTWDELQQNKMKRAILPFVEEKPCMLSMSLQNSDEWQHVARLWPRPAPGTPSFQTGPKYRRDRDQRSSTGSSFFSTDQLRTSRKSIIDDEEPDEEEEEIVDPQRAGTPKAPDILTNLEFLSQARSVMGGARFKQQMNKVAFQARYKSHNNKVSSSFVSLPAATGNAENSEDEDNQDTTSPTKRDALDMACEFGKSCSSKSMTMQGFRNYLVDGWEKPSFLNVSRWGLGDDPLKTLSQSHKRSLRMMQHGSFGGNRLTNEGLQNLAQSLGPSVSTLDFSENSFDGRGVEAFANCLKKGCLDTEAGCCMLLQINLRRNRLSDQTIVTLCKALIIATPKLQGLGLAETNIGTQQCGGEALGEFLSKHRELRTADLHSNHFHGNGAYAFFTGLYENGFEDPSKSLSTLPKKCGQLRSLDLSWNCLHGRDSWRIVRILGSTLRDCNTLFHLDLSFNRLTAEDCQVLADSLMDNHSLFGIHLVGNSAVVNADGFVLPWQKKGEKTSPSDAIGTGLPGAAYLTTDHQEQSELAQRRERIAQGERMEREGKLRLPTPEEEKEEKDQENAPAEKPQSRPVSGDSSKSGKSEEYEPRSAPPKPSPRRFETVRLRGPVLSNFQPTRFTRVNRRSLAADRLSQTANRLSHVISEDFLNRTAFGKVYSESPIFRTVPRKVLDPATGRRLEQVVQAEWLRVLTMSIRPELRTPIHCQIDSERRPSILDGTKSIWDIPALAQSAKEFGQLNRSEDVVYSATPCCWICENWQEVPFTFIPGLSCAQEADGIRHVCVFVAIDNFVRPLVLSRVEMDSGKPNKPNVRFEGVRMLPPTSMPLEVIFQVNDRIEATLDMDRAFLKEPIQVLMHKFEDGPEKVVQEIAGEEEDPWDMVTEVVEVNVICVGEMAAERRNGMRAVGACIEDIEGLRCKPRMVLPSKLHVVIEKWSIQKSVFASHRDVLDEDLYDAEDRCFWVDWRMVEQKFSKRKEAHDPLRRMDEVRDLLRESYSALRHLYKFFSTFDRSGGEMFAIWLNAFGRLVTNECGMSRNIPRDAFDRLFITCKFLPNEFLVFVTAGSGNGLIRFQFVEAMVRLADLVCGTECGGELANALRKLLDDYVLPAAVQHVDQFTRFRTALLCERVDGIYQQCIGSLRTIYDFYAGKHQHRPEKVVPMVVSEWNEFLGNVDAWDSNFTQRSSPWCFAVGKCVCPDEASTERHMELEFVEFLVSLGFVLFMKATSEDEVSGLQLFPEVLEEFFDDVLVPHAEVVIEWSGSSIVAHLGGKLRGFDVSPEWLSTLASFLQRVFQLADDDLSGELSLREFRTAMQSQEVKQFLLNLGLEVPHLEQFFEEADLDGNGEVSLAEALIGFATMKERLKNDERGLAFLRMIFEGGECNTTLTKEQFLEAFGRPKVLERVRQIGIFGTLEDFWDFVATKDELTIEELLSGYLQYRDPHRGGDKVIAFLRELFAEVDEDGNGVLSKQEFMSILKKGKSLEKLKTLGMGFDTQEEAAEALLLFSYEFDVDYSGQISLDEMINGFMRCRDTMRLRILEEAGYDHLTHDGNEESRMDTNAGHSRGGQAPHSAKHQLR